MWTGFSYCFVDLKSTERQPRDDVDAAYDDIHDVEVESAHSRDVIVALPVAPKAGREDVEVDAGERHARRKQYEHTGSEEVGPLVSPVDEADEGGGGVARPGDGRDAEADGGQPQKHHPADGACPGHDAGVSFLFAHGYVLVDAVTHE